MPTAGFIISGFCFSVLSGLLFKASGFGKKYAIGEKSVLLKCGRKTVNLCLDEIKYITLLSIQEARSFLEEMHLASVTAERQLDFRGWIKSQCRSGEVVRFMSIPLTGTDQRAGHPANIIKYTVKPNEELILLRTLKSSSRRREKSPSSGFSGGGNPGKTKKQGVFHLFCCCRFFFVTFFL